MEYINAKKILLKNKSSAWFGTDYNMNIYKGCCHGCIYCDSRSDCYNIDNFDIVRAKKDALLLLRNELKSKIKIGIIGTGSMSDPYNPFEKELMLTRHSLELIDAYNFGVAIATKSALIIRDIDILKNIKSHSPVICKMTVTASDDNLCSQIEPNVSPSSQRFLALKELSSNGIFAGILLMPVLPFIEDTAENISSIIDKAAEAGVKFIYPAFGVTLRSNQKNYFYDMLDKEFPSSDFKIKYINTYSGKYNCTSPNAKYLWKIFSQKCRKYGILYNMKDIISASQLGYTNKQLTLF